MVRLTSQIAGVFSVFLCFLGGGLAQEKPASGTGNNVPAAQKSTTSSPVAGTSASNAGDASDKVQQAFGHFSRGVELYDEKDFRSAYYEFRRAYDIAPHFRVLYNIALCEAQMRDYARAVRSFELYLQQGASAVPVERQTLVRDEIAKAMQRVAFLEVRTDVVGAEISIDDEVVGKSPLNKPILVNIGQRKVSAVQRGGVPVVQPVELAGGDRRSVDLVVPKPSLIVVAGAQSAEEEKAAQKKAEAEQRLRLQRIIISGSVAGALALSAAITGGLALKARSDRDDEIGKIPGDAKAIDDANSRMRNLAIVTDVLLGAAVVSGAVTLYFGLTHRPKKAGKGGKKPTSVRVGASPTSIQLSGTF